MSKRSKGVGEDLDKRLKDNKASKKRTVSGAAMGRTLGVLERSFSVKSAGGKRKREKSAGDELTERLEASMASTSRTVSGTAMGRTLDLLQRSLEEESPKLENS